MLPIMRAGGKPPPWAVEKVGIFTPPSGSAYGTVTDWSVRDGCNNDAAVAGILVPEDATVSIKAVASRVTTASNLYSIRLTLNGALLGSPLGGSGTNKTHTITYASVAVVAGDVIGFDWASGSTSTSGQLEGGAATYIEALLV